MNTNCPSASKTSATISLDFVEQFLFVAAPQFPFVRDRLDGPLHLRVARRTCGEAGCAPDKLAFLHLQPAVANHFLHGAAHGRGTGAQFGGNGSQGREPLAERVEALADPFFDRLLHFAGGQRTLHVWLCCCVSADAKKHQSEGTGRRKNSDVITVLREPPGQRPGSFYIVRM